MGPFGRIGGRENENDSVRLKRAGENTPEAARERKPVPWKVAIPAFMKQKMQVTNRWICDRLSMGTPVAVGHHVGQLRRSRGPAHELLETLALNFKGVLPEWSVS